MKHAAVALLLLFSLAGCHGSRAGAAAEESPTPTATPTAIISPTPPPTPVPPPQLHVRFLGVGGFQFKVGDEGILTAPLFTDPDMITVSIGAIAPKPSLIDAGLGDVSGTRAILSGHAHYDHLLDVPYVLTKTPDALVYGNSSAKHLLAGFAPDPAPGCPAATPPPFTVDRSRVIALDDPANDVVDYRMCPEMQTCTGVHTGEGAWVNIPDSHIRIRALCSSHPAQILDIIHFAPGCVTDDSCGPETNANNWKEGLTLAYLIDFLDPATGAPRYRIYYQDAPFTAPISHPHPSLLEEKQVDLAIVNGGNWETVVDHPKPILSALTPRYAIVGHWEDFFRTQQEPFQPLPFLNKDTIQSRMNDVMPANTSWIPDPGTEFTFDAQ